jgi:cell fate (sporulation/competence/biofilm development) regulator YlbF (YheA/YmcA/DUF963 family)
MVRGNGRFVHLWHRAGGLRQNRASASAGFAFVRGCAVFAGPRGQNLRAHHHSMLNSDQQTVILAKTRELCDTLLRQPDVAAACRSVEAFMADEPAQGLYQELMRRGQALHEQQERGLPLADSEIAEFERQREALTHNPVAKGFLDARELLHNIHHTVNDHVSKTFELGRLPEEADFESGCCGGNHGGCGCEH